MAGSDTSKIMDLATPYTNAPASDWQDAVDKALKGAPIDKITGRTYDGVAIKPLYTADDVKEAAPLPLPDRRMGEASWDMRGVYFGSDAKAANEEIMTDLSRGITSLSIRMSDLDDAKLATVLEGVLLDLAPISIDVGAGFGNAARALIRLWQDAKIKPEDARGEFNADPLGTLAGTGSLPGSLDDAYDNLAALATRLTKDWPHAKAVSVNVRPYHNAGCSEAQELAAMLSTGLCYLKAMTDRGLSIDEAAAQIAIKVMADPDMPLTIAKLRAVRLVWAKLLDASGAKDTSAYVSAETSVRALIRRDHHVNSLRATSAAFAAAAGGANVIIVHGFEEAHGTASKLSRRIARNTQIMLDEESGLGRVADPAAGSYALEALTNDLAQAGWALFQEIEAAGGWQDALLSGDIAKRIADVRAARDKDIAKRKRPLTGLSEFPDVAEDLPTPTPPSPPSGFAPDWKGEPVTIEGLGYHGIGEAFEALRGAADAAKASGKAPQIFLANLGPIAKHTARATFAKNFFETGGIEALASDGFDDPAAMAEGFKASGAKLAILCGSDDQYEDAVATFAPALKESGASYIYLAGKAGDKEQTYRDAGIDEFIAMGMDVVSCLQNAHKILGISS